MDDPTEHNDLARAMPDKVDSLISQLQNVSRTFFNPNRGVGDPRACKAAAANGVTVTVLQKGKPTRVNHPFFVPWLELPPDDDVDAL